MGTWVTDEVMISVERGYRVIEMFEVYQHEITRYNPETVSAGYLPGFLFLF